MAADAVVLHNPALLKFDSALPLRILAHHLIVVSHENFLRPGGEAAFDVSGCLGRIERASLALRRSIAPVSDYNRQTVRGWMQQARPSGWSILDATWFNVVDGPACRPPPNRGTGAGAIPARGSRSSPRSSTSTAAFRRPPSAM